MRGLLSLLSTSLLCASSIVLGACGASQTSSDAAGDAGGGSSSGGGDSGSHADGGDGGPVETLGVDGGTVSQLYFAVAGDTRPPTIDDVSGYPTAVITKIFEDIEALDPRPPFMLSTGDYQYSSTRSSSTATQQIGLYMQARAKYSGLLFPGMGNHECTGADDSNCGPGNYDGVTPNYTTFMTDMLGPIKKTVPYYSFNVNAVNGSWTAKFVVTAPNAWDTAQQTWLTSVLAQKTTYTFVIRHEPSSSSGNPAGVAPIDALLTTYPPTILIVGHTHSYGHYSDTPRVALLGNGGAPLGTAGKDYGFGTFMQRADGAIVCDEIDYMTGAKDSSYHFVITADGTLTQ